MQRVDYATTIPRALLALVAGAVTGTLVFLLELGILLALRPNKLQEMADFVGTTYLDLLQLTATAVLSFFAGGLLVVGAPLWALLHFLKRRDWYYAVALGAGLCAAGFFVMALWNPDFTPAVSLVSFLTEEFGGLVWNNEANQFNEEGWQAILRGTTLLAVAGALSGLTLWKIAYRRPRPPEARPQSA
jgi:hypothetical protein